MPAPVSSPSSAVTAPVPANPLTHKVCLNNGTSFTVIDPNRPGKPWIFANGVTVNVPEHIAKRLNTKAQDSVTVKVGQKISAQQQPKFNIERISGVAPIVHTDEN